MSHNTKIIVGYNDLTQETFWDEAIISPGKSFELICSINKIGIIESEFNADLVFDNDQATETINTEFEITTFWQNVSLYSPSDLTKTYPTKADPISEFPSAQFLI